VAFVLKCMSAFWRTVACLMLILLCVTVPLRAEEEEDYQPIFPSEEEEFRVPPRFHAGKEIPSFPAADTAVEEEDLAPEQEQPSRPTVVNPFPSEQLPSFPSSLEAPYPSSSLPPPGPTPPFLSRPLEWEVTPPSVIGMPPLPPVTSFSGRDLVAFQFIEEGKEHFEREEWDVAQEHFERAISIAPLLPYSYYFLGRIAFAHGDLKRALAFLQKAELLFPRSERAWLGETTSVKGTIYEDLQDYEHARTAYRRSLRFQPANLKVLSALARLPEEESPPSDIISQ
jgi:hypothetical protein